MVMRWSELSRTAAKAHMAEVVAALPAAVEGLRTTSDLALDHSRQSLGPLWAWVLTQPNTGGILPASAPGVPVWYPYRAAFCEHYGVEASLVGVMDGVAAYYATCLQHAQPDRVWTVGGRNARDTGYAHYNTPVLQLGEHDAIPHVQIPTFVERAVVAGKDDKRAPDALIGLFDMATGVAGRTA